MAASKSTVQAVLDAMTNAGDKVVSLFSGLMAACLILYGGYALYDTVYTQNQAYGSSWDLLRYRPEIIDDDSVALTAALAQVNDDYRAWLTIYDTNIDYPVMQGEDDLYYASHDYKKDSSLTGALYLAAANSADCSDNYNLVYGHHMDANALFGGLDNFTDRSYFNNHLEGVLVTRDSVYDLEIFAVSETDAYESAVYNAGNRDLAELRSFIVGNNVIYDATTAADATKILAMSTCESAETNGRLVVFATMTEREVEAVTPVVPDNPTEPTDPTNPTNPTNPDDGTNPTDTGEATTDNPQNTNPATVVPGATAVPGGGPAAPAAPGAAPAAVGVAAPPAAVEAPAAPDAPVEGAAEPQEEAIDDQGNPLANLFRPTGGSYVDAWALVNLICLIMTIYLFVPLGHIKAKLRRYRKMHEVNAQKSELRKAHMQAQPLDVEQLKDLEQIYRIALNERGTNPTASVLGTAVAAGISDEEFDDAVREVYYNDEPFNRRLRIGLVAELVISLVALIAFILTEDMRLPMILIDEWTPLMLLFLLACWIVDVRLARYRDDAPEVEDEDTSASGASSAPTAA